MKFVPHEYQKYAIQRIKTDPACGLFLDMGLGKTAITLTAIADLLAVDEIHKVLVIAPLQTARNTWGSEAEKWDHLDDLRLSLVLGTLKQRKAALEQPADVYVINRENVPWLCEYIEDGFPFDMVVIDELSSFKSASAKRFKALRKKMPFVKKVVGLTGTPAPNSYLDLWSEIYLLDRGKRLGKTVGIYKRSFFHPVRMNGHIVYEWGLNYGAKDLIDKFIADICVSMKAVDYLEMPDRVNTEVYVTMDEPERKLYDKFGRERVLETINEEDRSTGTIVGVNAAAVGNKLLQLANGFAYDDKKKPILFHEKKLDALGELVEAAGSRNLLVYYEFIADRDRILARFPEAKLLEGPEDVKNWNAGKIKMLVAHPASAGHGLNLQDGGNTVVWFGLPWNLEYYQQANARVYRQGQKETVYIYHILTRDTHDIDVLAALNKKDLSQKDLLEALKARIDKWKTDSAV